MLYININIVNMIVLRLIRNNYKAGEIEIDLFAKEIRYLRRSVPLNRQEKSMIA